MKNWMYMLLAMLILGTGSANAQSTASFSVAPRVGYEIDLQEALSLGAEARVRLGDRSLVLNPVFDHYFVDEGIRLQQLQANLLYDFGVANQVFTPYTGVGVALTRSAVGDFEAANDWGLNLIGGAYLGDGPIRPFVQTQLTFGAAELTTVTGGILIRLGR